MKSVTAVWFEIPVQDMGRAMRFYQDVFQVSLEEVKLGEDLMAWLPFDHENGQGASGTLILKPDASPAGASGPLLYLGSLHDDVAQELSRVEAAGGKIIQQKTVISEDHGCFGIIEDTEGNHIGFHSSK